MPVKPLVVVTRKLPDAIETRMMELFDVRLNLDDRPMTQAAADRGGARPPTCWCPRSPTGSMPRVLAQAGTAAEADRQLRHRRRPYRPEDRAPARHHGHQHAGRADRGHRRHDHGADPGRAAPPGRGRAADALAATGRAGARPRCSATASGASGSASSAWAASAPPWRAAPAASASRCTTTTAAASMPSLEARARGDLLGEPRPDAGAHGHHLGQLPAHAGDLSPAVGAAAEAAAAARLCRQHLARRGDRRERADPHAGAGRDRRRRPRRVRARAGDQSEAAASSTTSCCCRTWARPRSKAASTWARRSSSTSRPSPTATSRPTACWRRCSRKSSVGSPSPYPLPLAGEGEAGRPFTPSPPQGGEGRGEGAVGAR